MLVEVKTGDERLYPAQKDTLSAFAAAIDEALRLRETPIKVPSRPSYIVPGEKKIVWHGAHLLRVPPAYQQQGPFFWDLAEIDKETLVKVLSMDNDPRSPEKKLDIDRRHKAAKPNDQEFFWS